jgi:hypothetical protein
VVVWAGRRRARIAAVKIFMKNGNKEGHLLLGYDEWRKKVWYPQKPKKEER